MTDDVSEIEALGLSLDAKIMLGTTFGMAGSKTSLTFQMRESKPTARAQAALDELVENRYLSVEDINGFGGKTYRPLSGTSGFYRWVGVRCIPDPERSELMRTLILSEPING